MLQKVNMQDNLNLDGRITCLLQVKSSLKMMIMIIMYNNYVFSNKIVTSFAIL